MSRRNSVYGWRTGWTACLAAILVCQSVPLHAQATIKILVAEGDGAINNIRERRAREPVVRVVDDDEVPVKGATVTFVAPELGASGSFLTGATMTALTDDNGEVVGRGWRPNNVAGQFELRVTASFQGATARASITQTNVAPAGPQAGSSKKIIAILAILGGGAAAGVALGLGGKGGGTATAAPVTAPPAVVRPPTSITPGTGGFGPP